MATSVGSVSPRQRDRLPSDPAIAAALTWDRLGDQRDDIDELDQRVRALEIVRWRWAGVAAAGAVLGSALGAGAMQALLGLGLG